MKKKIMRFGFALLASIFLATLVALGGGDGGIRFGPISVFSLCAIVAFGINWLAFIPANVAGTERYYDLTGSLTYLSVIIIALMLSGDPGVRAMIVSAMVVIWAFRLGSFLFLRIRRDGRDDRFDEIKTEPSRFFIAWTIQALWVVLTVACALAVITGGSNKAIGLIGLIGIFAWVCGFLIEVIADRQKSKFKCNPLNRGQFISTGLWSWSRHPNYFGEMLLWAGIAIIAMPVLAGWQWVALISPLFVYALITHISGINKLEAKAEKKWGDDTAYQAYKLRTSILILRPARK